jgi:hypothetical protein
MRPRPRQQDGLSIGWRARRASRALKEDFTDPRSGETEDDDPNQLLQRDDFQRTPIRRRRNE